MTTKILNRALKEYGIPPETARKIIEYCSDHPIKLLISLEGGCVTQVSSNSDGVVSYEVADMDSLNEKMSSDDLDALIEEQEEFYPFVVEEK